MKLIIDENMPPPWTPFLASYGLEARPWATLGEANAPDREIMEYATLHGSVILTRDLDFGTYLSRHGLLSPSVIQVRIENVSTQAIGEQVIAAIRQHEAALIVGALVTVECWTSPRTKLNLLPIARRRPE